MPFFAGEPKQSQSQSHAVPTYDASIVLVKSVKVDPELA